MTEADKKACHTVRLALLFGQPREKVFSMKLWLRFAAVWIFLAVIGLAVLFYVSPDGLTWLSGVLIVLLAWILLY
jgi:hypothetical protein